MAETAFAVRELTFGDAIKEAIAEEMRRDPNVVLMGEDVAEAGTTFKVLTGLVDEFGKDRVIDTPISEAGFTGLGVGAAMAGMRPIVDIMFGDFMTIIMDQLVNQAAKIHYMSGGHWKVPMVVRCTMGATRRSAAQHSQSLHAWPSHVPGLKVVVPSTPMTRIVCKAAVPTTPVVLFDTRSATEGEGTCRRITSFRSRGRREAYGTDITLNALSSKFPALAPRRCGRGRMQRRCGPAHHLPLTSVARESVRRRALHRHREGYAAKASRSTGFRGAGRLVLLSGRARAPDGGDARADSVLPVARGRHRAERAPGVRRGPRAV